MKIDRLIGILSILLQEEKTTAPELAERFEVSRRTINRDIEDLCKAGIPIKTAQGTGGGISIMDGYRMDRTILSSKDMQMILAGLRSLDSVSGSRYYSQLMEKIQIGSSEFISERIFCVMEQKNITQLELSRRTGIATSNISDWKKKKTNPKADCLLSICDALEITPEQLLTGKGIDPEYKDEDANYEVTRSDIKILKQIHSLGDEQYKRLMAYMKALQKLEQMENMVEE